MKGFAVGVKVIVSTNRPYSVLVSTPIMQRAHHLKASSEIIFIDSSSSCDVTQTAVTLVLTASKAGAVPLAVLLHENQTQLRCLFAFCITSNLGSKIFVYYLHFVF